MRICQCCQICMVERRASGLFLWATHSSPLQLVSRLHHFCIPNRANSRAAQMSLSFHIHMTSQLTMLPSSIATIVPFRP